jgi:hypothetical protein
VPAKSKTAPRSFNVSPADLEIPRCDGAILRAAEWNSLVALLLILLTIAAIYWMWPI